VRQERIVTARDKPLTYRSVKVIGLVRNDVSNAAAGVGNVTRVARDYMQMEMGYRLTGCGSFVETNIETIWTESFADHSLSLIDRRPDRGFLDRV
jgi:hypothetical protein